MNIEILTSDQRGQLGKLISTAHTILVCTHVNADGDAIGSSLAWADYLRSLGKDPVVVVPNQYPDFLQWLPNTEKVVRYDKHKEQVELLMNSTDLICCLDFNTPTRTEELAPVLTATKVPKVLIDHHLKPDVESVLTVSCPEMSSTSELIFRIVWQMGGFENLGRQFAVPLYCGMMTDTGGFTYNSSRPEIFFIISQLLTKGIDKDKIFRNVYHNYSEDRLRLMGYIMYQKLRTDRSRHASYFTLTRSEMRRFHFIKGDAEGLVNLPLQIKGAKLSISLREDTEKDKVIWVSLRSVDDFPCNLMAEQFFNGGGHLNASGGRLNCTMDEAEKITQEAICAFTDKLK